MSGRRTAGAIIETVRVHEVADGAYDAGPEVRGVAQVSTAWSLERRE